MSSLAMRAAGPRRMLESITSYTAMYLSGNLVMSVPVSFWVREVHDQPLFTGALLKDHAKRGDDHIWERGGRSIAGSAL